MTCILAVRYTKNKIYLAGDRRITADDELYTMPQPKVSKRNGVLLGVCGDAGFCQLVNNSLKIPTPFQDTARYINFAFVNSVKSLLKATLCDVTDSEIMVVVNNEVWTVEVGLSKEDHKLQFSATQHQTPIAIGSGSLPVIAAYLASNEGSTIDKIQNAYNIVADLIASVDNNVDIIKGE